MLKPTSFFVLTMLTVFTKKNTASQQEISTQIKNEATAFPASANTPPPTPPPPTGGEATPPKG